MFRAPWAGTGLRSRLTSEPDARTAAGAWLGAGWVQREGGSFEEVRPSDVVWIPPGLKHWHGATPCTAITHIAIRESLDGKAVVWLEQ